MRRCLTILASALMWSAVASAQTAIMPVIRSPWQGDRSTPMRLQSLGVDVKIVGHIATTTWDMTVYNPQSRVLEGELVFPIGDGQTVSRFAMDVNGRLREGVIVEKDRGRQVFEAIVRRGVDPGLLERTAGNSFRARVYPIPARGTKRLVIAYEQELTEAGRAPAAGMLYHLPLAFSDTVDLFHLRVEVLDEQRAPVLQSSPLAHFAFKAWQRAFVADDTQRDIVLNKALSFVVPRSAGSQRAYVEQANGERYFYVTVFPGPSRQAKVLPSRLLIVWDASASARGRDRVKELQLLDSYVGRLANPQMALAIFRNAMEPIRRGTWAELRKAIETAPLDGATWMGAIDLSKEQADEALLFSDGLSTLGSGTPRFPKCPVVAVNSALAAEHSWLRSVSEGTGGEYLNLATLPVKGAIQSLTTSPLAFIGATFNPSEMSEVYPSRAAAVHGPLGIAGRFRSARARITLHFGFGRQETFSRTIQLDEQSLAAAPIARVWAQKKLAELDLDPTCNAAAILALGQQHGIVTRGTSLIVLDTVDDYLRYRITPPDELRAEYEKRRSIDETSRARAEKDHLEAVVAQFVERKSWWQTEFKAVPITARTQPVIGRELGAVGGTVVSERRAANSSLAAAPAQAMDAAAEYAQVAKMAREEGGRATQPEMRASITLGAWSPDTPYLKELKASARARQYLRYLELREHYGTTPGFFLDVSDYFREQGDATLALRILSNLAELKLEDPALLRVLGYRLRQLGLHALAAWSFEQVLVLRSEDPQSLRDLALALADAGETGRAVRLMWDVVRKPWDSRFHDVNIIAVGELNAIIARAKTRPDLSGIDPRLIENLPVDIRVVLNWDTPDSDMDLHVVDPRGEECFYGQPRTSSGGRLSADVTTGFGPEEFLLKTGVPGKYQVRAKFFGTRQQTAIGATTVVLELYLRYATGRMENKSITLRLEGPGRMVDVGTFEFANTAK